jgi:hypothetical protein
MNSHEALVSAASAGLGIIQVADYYAHSRIQRGDLVEILQGFKTEGHIISAVFSKQQPFPPKIRAFVDFLAHQFNRSPWSANAENAALRRSPKNDRPAPRPKVRHARYQPASSRERLARGRKPNTRA